MPTTWNLNLWLFLSILSISSLQSEATAHISGFCCPNLFWCVPVFFTQGSVSPQSVHRYMLHFGLLVSSSSSHAQIVKLNFWQSVIPHHTLWCSLESQDSASDLDLEIKVTDFCVNSTRGIYGINLKTQNWFIFKSSYSQIWASMPTACVPYRLFTAGGVKSLMN